MHNLTLYIGTGGGVSMCRGCQCRGLVSPQAAPRRTVCLAAPYFRIPAVVLHGSTRLWTAGRPYLSVTTLRLPHRQEARCMQWACASRAATCSRVRSSAPLHLHGSES